MFARIDRKATLRVTPLVVRGDDDRDERLLLVREVQRSIRRGLDHRGRIPAFTRHQRVAAGTPESASAPRAPISVVECRRARRLVASAASRRSRGSGSPRPCGVVRRSSRMPPAGNPTLVRGSLRGHESTPQCAPRGLVQTTRPPQVSVDHSPLLLAVPLDSLPASGRVGLARESILLHWTTCSGAPVCGPRATIVHYAPPRRALSRTSNQTVVMRRVPRRPSVCERHPRARECPALVRQLVTVADVELHVGKVREVERRFGQVKRVDFLAVDRDPLKTSALRGPELDRKLRPSAPRASPRVRLALQTTSASSNSGAPAVPTAQAESERSLSVRRRLHGAFDPSRHSNERLGTLP